MRADFAMRYECISQHRDYSRQPLTTLNIVCRLLLDIVYTDFCDTISSGAMVFTILLAKFSLASLSIVYADFCSRISGVTVLAMRLAK